MSETKISTSKGEINYDGRINRLFVDDNSIHIVGSPYEIIRSYDDDGSLIKETGKKGPANWEISSVWWYDENDSTYTIYDYGKNLINRFDSETDSLLLSYKFASRSNVIKYDINKFLSSQINEKGDFEFVLIDITDGSYKKNFSINDILVALGVEEKKDLDFLLYGDFAGSQESPEIFIYYCLNAPIFFRIDLEKETVQLYKDFRYEFMPEVYRSGNNVVLNPNQNWFVSGAIIKDKIYLLTIKQNEYYVEIDSKWFLDIYDLKTGLYAESILLERSEDEYFPFEIRNRDNEIIIGWNFEKLKIYEFEK
ncbi:hypothetical protein [Algoriphagus marincola]|uniref:hypothetical protein n=1 Tax=Algoriphagus marincola TaxID=264027 RepID=UPI00040E4988|nr:hypothetical protein [Algoriphagus marincola]